MEKAKYAVLDIETTGLDYKEDEMTEIGIVLLDEKFKEVGTLNHMVKINAKDVPPQITKLTGITKEDTEKGISKRKAKSVLKKVLKDKVVVIQNAAFDLSFIETITGKSYDFIDTQVLSLVNNPKEKAGLKPQAERHGLFIGNHHHALDDAKVTALLLKIYASEKSNKTNELENFVNYLVVRPDRPMKRIPYKTVQIDVLDGTNFKTVLKNQ